VAQGVAIKNLLNVFGISQYLLFIPIWLSVVTYSSLGGLKAVVQTDILQIILVTLALLVITIFSVNSFNFSGDILPIQDVTLSTAINWFIWPCCYMLIEQDMMQRSIAAESSKTMRKAALFSAIGMMAVAFMPVLIGVIAKSQMPDMAESKGILLLFAKNYLSPSLYMLTLTAAILAILSTLDSVLCAISSNIAYDFQLPKNCFGQQLISVDTIITAIIGILSLIAVYYCENIINILLFSYGLCVSVLFVSLVSGLILKNPQKPAAILSMAFGFISFVVFSIMWNDLSYISIIFSAGGYLIAHIFRGIIKNQDNVAS
jgi:SSS family solute:Na+ symporter